MFKILTTCYNCESFIGECIESVLSQDEEDWEMYIIDDASSDDTIGAAVKASNQDSRIKILRNKKNTGLVFNQTINFAFHAKPNDEDVIVILDGDDYLNNSRALSYLKQIYSKGYWLTYGGIDHTPLRTHPEDFYSEVDWSVSLRNQTFCLVHLRSYKFFLLKNIQNIDLKDKEENFFKFGVDVALGIPMAEMAGKNKCFHIKHKLYYYRFHDNNVHESPKKEKKRWDHIRGDLSFRVPYKKKTKEQLIEEKCDWAI